MKYTIIRLLLFIYLASTYLGATHIHHKAFDSSTDCKVHFLIKNLNSADTTDSSFNILNCLVCFEYIPFNTNYFIQPIIKGFNSQAPPYFS